MNISMKAATHCAIAILLTLVSGCFSGTDVSVGKVSGVVTKDGQPLPDATVTFFPTGGRPSIGMTDDQGRYELIFTESVKGAMVGTHKVNISFGGSQAPGEAGGSARPKRVLPPQSVDWPDTVEVTDSSNQLDFDL